MQQFKSNPAQKRELMSYRQTILNLCDHPGSSDCHADSYIQGHRNARHSAAEIANEADARIVEPEARLAEAELKAKRTEVNNKAQEDAYLRRIKELQARLEAETARAERMNRAINQALSDLQGICNLTDDICIDEIATVIANRLSAALAAPDKEGE